MRRVPSIIPVLGLSCLILSAAAHAQGTPPDMVQVGNEVTPGMLWPEGRVDGEYDTEEQWRAFAELLQAGAAAVRAVVGDRTTEDTDPGPVFVATARPEQSISLEVQAQMVEDLHDYATLRFVDERTEAILEDDASGTRAYVNPAVNGNRHWQAGSSSEAGSVVLA